MPKKGEILWEVGKQLTKEVWTRGEFVQSEVYQIPDTCSLRIYFYPAGVGDVDYPTFKFVRTNTSLASRRIKGDVQLYHLDTLAASFILDHVFERGESEFFHHFSDYLTLHRLKIFHSLPELSYLWRYIVLDPDPNEPEPEPAPEPQPLQEPEPEPQTPQEPGIIESGISYVLSYFCQADGLAKEGCYQDTPSSSELTYLELQSLVNSEVSKEWRISPDHHWYAGKEPGSTFSLNCDRASRTIISRLASGHTRGLSFFQGKKVFAICTRCNTEEASPEHILECLGLSKDDIFSSPLLVLDFIRVNGLLDLV